MNKMIYLLLGLVLFTSACKKDKGDGLERLQYDKSNVTGPFLQTGTWEAGVRFDEAEVAKYVGKRLTKVEYYIGNSPENLVVRVYEDDNNLPSVTPVYEASLGGTTTAGRWNTHNLSIPFTITNEPIWITVELRHAQDQQSIGCDAGPAIDGGDWLYSSSDNEWKTYRDRTNQNEDINWNIRGVIEE